MMMKVFSVNGVNDDQPVQINEITRRPVLLPEETLHLLQGSTPVVFFFFFFFKSKKKVEQSAGGKNEF